VFANTGQRRGVEFLGLAVPGAAETDLKMTTFVAVWKAAERQSVFQNYQA